MEVIGPCLQSGILVENVKSLLPAAIDGKSVDLEFDTGASVTIIPKSIWTDVLVSKPVERTDVKPRSSISGHEIPVIGEAKDKVAYRDKKAVLPVVITGMMVQCW